MNRRSFLKRTSAAALGAVAFPTIIPASAFGAGGTVAPSNRTVIGCIGMGGMGNGNMKSFLEFADCQIVAVCDVDRERLNAAQKIVNETYGTTGCAVHDDFRELLDRDDIDAVSLALPDHWHSIPAITAAKKGLDIYGEKPLALTINESKAIVDAVERYNIVWQTGSWQRSQKHFHKAAQLIRNGRIGEVHTVQVGLPTGKPLAEPAVAEPVPAGFNYDMWLGPAPEAPYTKNRCHWNFRWILDYSGGQLTDWCGHHGDIANWGLGTEDTGPTEIWGVGTFPREGLWDAATDYKFYCQFAPGASPVAPNGFMMVVSNGFPMGARWEGTHGWIHVDRGKRLTASDPAILESVIGPNEVHLYESDNHHKNFLDCVRSRQKTITPATAAHRAISIAHLGNIAMQLERKVQWDPQAEQFVNDPEANRKLGRAMRAPWHI